MAKQSAVSYTFYYYQFWGYVNSIEKYSSIIAVGGQYDYIATTEVQHCTFWVAQSSYWPQTAIFVLLYDLISKE